jgi:hypothetical protein
MAAAVFTKEPGVYLERLENFDTQTLLRIGLGAGIEVTDAERLLGHTPDSARRQALSMATKGYAEFDFAMSADTNTAGVINLTDDMLVDFLTPSHSRRVDVECFISADVDKAIVKEELLVACAATPIVYRLLQGFTADSAAATNARATGAGDLSVTVLASAAVLSQSSNDVILTLTGVSAIDTRWVGKIRVYPKVYHPLIATT